MLEACFNVSSDFDIVALALLSQQVDDLEFLREFRLLLSNKLQGIRLLNVDIKASGALLENL